MFSGVMMDLGLAGGEDNAKSSASDGAAGAVASDVDVGVDVDVDSALTTTTAIPLLLLIIMLWQLWELLVAHGRCVKCVETGQGAGRHRIMATNSPPPPPSQDPPTNSHLQIHATQHLAADSTEWILHRLRREKAEKTKQPKSEIEMQEAMQWLYYALNGRNGRIKARNVSLELLGSRSREDNVGHSRQRKHHNCEGAENVHPRYIWRLPVFNRGSLHRPGCGWHLGCLHVDEKRLHGHDVCFIHLWLA